ncbi:hypothetical protein LX32DRAFT_29639 [Colletotrichum zoysiae]|uniref:Uncharacterized protein n=1 Tax=Colletotrichum zoysiae TaxID=1216348 RepID=A0AAD9HCK4_9PEZI|nr:hypothetical protein LX32DRAFT_29639 [Colletotrichum zoysiae]
MRASFTPSCRAHSSFQTLLRSPRDPWLCSLRGCTKSRFPRGGSSPATRNSQLGTPTYSGQQKLHGCCKLSFVQCKETARSFLPWHFGYAGTRYPCKLAQVSGCALLRHTRSFVGGRRLPPSFTRGMISPGVTNGDPMAQSSRVGTWALSMSSDDDPRIQGPREMSRSPGPAHKSCDISS